MEPPQKKNRHTAEPPVIEMRIVTKPKLVERSVFFRHYSFNNL